MSEFKQVTKAEFDEFVLKYPKELIWNVTTICEPPLGNYNDFTDGKVWPESMVAQVQMYDGSDYHCGETEKYYIPV